ncbi:MAG: Lrp/AsnC family transcriptional regulator [Clostridia bacterium]|nr:Lrp/AsnC family transcriptional regulator [Clostridia bacterium]
MDELDLQIIRLLAQHADMTATQIKKIINLSIPAVNKRIQRLKENGIIKNFTVITDNKKIGKPIVAYIFVILQSSDFISSLLEYANADDDILECSAVTGEYDFLLKICAESIEKLDEKLTHLKKYRGIVKSNTMLSLTNYKYSTAAFPSSL